MPDASYASANHYIVLRKITLSLSSGPKFQREGRVICPPCLTLAVKIELFCLGDGRGAICSLVNPLCTALLYHDKTIFYLMFNYVGVILLL